MEETFLFDASVANTSNSLFICTLCIYGVQDTFTLVWSMNGWWHIKKMEPNIYKMEWNGSIGNQKFKEWRKKTLNSLSEFDWYEVAKEKWRKKFVEYFWDPHRLQCPKRECVLFHRINSVQTNISYALKDTSQLTWNFFHHKSITGIRTNGSGNQIVPKKIKPNFVCIY